MKLPVSFPLPSLPLETCEALVMVIAQPYTRVTPKGKISAGGGERGIYTP